MGFFDNAPAQNANGLAPLSIDRVRELLDRNEINYAVDEDGDLVGGWEFGGFFFIVSGTERDILCVRGRWYGELPVDRLDEANAFASAWNREHYWPKTYPVVSGEDTVLILCDHAVAYQYGLTDDQLEDHLNCGLMTGNSLFEALNEAFPEAVEESQVEEREE